MSEQDPRNHLSPDLLRIADRQLAFGEMHEGEKIHFRATDAATSQPGDISLTVASVRQSQQRERTTTDVTFQYQGGPFSFYDEDHEPVQLESGTLMEGGVSAVHIPQFVPSMIGLEGIGVGRDFSFEWVGGEERTVYVHHVQNLVQVLLQEGESVTSINVSDHLRQIEQTKNDSDREEREFIEGMNNRIKEYLNTAFPDQEQNAQISGIINSFSPIVRRQLTAIFVAAQEDGLLEATLTAYETEYKEYFERMMPGVRGNPGMQPETMGRFKRIIDTAGLEFPRKNPLVL